MMSGGKITCDLLASLTAEWEGNPSDVDITRRAASAWENYFQQKRDEGNLDGALYYYRHLNELLGGGDPAVVRKVMNLQKQKIGLRIKAIEDWLAQGGALHADAPAYRMELQKLQTELAELRSQPVPSAPPAKLFLDLSSDRNPPTPPDSAGFSAN